MISNHSYTAGRFPTQTRPQNPANSNAILNAAAAASMSAPMSQSPHPFMINATSSPVSSVQQLAAKGGVIIIPNSTTSSDKIRQIHEQEERNGNVQTHAMDLESTPPASSPSPSLIPLSDENSRRIALSAFLKSLSLSPPTFKLSIFRSSLAGFFLPFFPTASKLLDKFVDSLIKELKLHSIILKKSDKLLNPWNDKNFNKMVDLIFGEWNKYLEKNHNQLAAAQNTGPPLARISSISSMNPSLTTATAFTNTNNTGMHNAAGKDRDAASKQLFNAKSSSGSGSTSNLLASKTLNGTNLASGSQDLPTATMGAAASAAAAGLMKNGAGSNASSTGGTLASVASFSPTSGSTTSSSSSGSSGVNGVSGGGVSNIVPSPSPASAAVEEAKSNLRTLLELCAYFQSSSRLPSLHPRPSSLSKFSNWVIPSALMCGPYPGRDGINFVDGEESNANIRYLLEDGIDIFVCLQNEIPAQDQYCRIAPAQVLHPYFPAFDYYINDILALGWQKKKKFTFLYFPIRDGGVPDDHFFLASLVDILSVLARPGGHGCYIHCAGGHGRTGVYVACLLGMLYDTLTIEQVLAIVQEGHDSRQIRDRKLAGPCRSPTTMEQVEFVKRFLTWFRSYKIAHAKLKQNAQKSDSESNLLTTANHGGGIVSITSHQAQSRASKKPSMG